MRKIILCTLFSALCAFSLAFSQGNWELLVPSPTSNQLIGIFFVDAQTGWSVGEYGTILKSTDSGDNWKIIKTPWTYDLCDVHFPTASVGYAIGTDGHIIKSIDGGETWTKQIIQYSNNLHRVRFRDARTGWIIGEKGLILHTTDGGETWAQQTSNSREHLKGIDFIGTTGICVVGENQAILLTNDEGYNWESIIHETRLEYSFDDVFFSDDKHGWICGVTYSNFTGILLQTSNGGMTWEEMNNPSMNFYSFGLSTSGQLPPFQQIYFYDDLSHGIGLTQPDFRIFINDGYFSLQTMNGGRSWSGNLIGEVTAFNKRGRFSVLSEDRVISTGFRGSFRISTDGGLTWNFKNPEHRWWNNLFIGKHGNLLVSRVRFRFEEDDELLNKYYRSNDYGTSWNEYQPRFFRSDGTEVILNQPLETGLFFNNQDTIWVIIREPEIKKQFRCISTDFGLTFHQLNMAESLANRFITPDTLISYILLETEVSPGNSKSVLYFYWSFDGGRTGGSVENDGIWNDITPPDFYNQKSVNNHYFFNGHTGFLVGSEGNIIKTDDVGQTWTNIYSGVVEDLWAIKFLNRQIGFVVGDFGRILKTEDGGLTWRKVDSGTQEDVYSIAFLNDKEGWVGTENGLRYTQDGGETWKGVPLPYEHGLIRKIEFDDEGNGFAYTYNGLLSMVSYYDTDTKVGSHVYFLRMLNSTTDMSNNSPAQSLPTDPILFPNYPNPFNATTKIEYQLSQAGPVTLKIYNLQGQLVRTLVEEDKRTGSHSVQWDGQSDAGKAVASGIYVYVLESAGCKKSEKLLLLK